MKNLLKKLHIVSTQSEDAEWSTSSRTNKFAHSSSPDRLHSRSHHNSEHKPFSGLSNWLNSVTNRHSHSSQSSSHVRGERMEPSDSGSTSGLEVVLDTAKRDSESSNSKDPDIDEEYQIQQALELSAREDPEAVQIEAVKQISLGSCDPENTPAEVIAYRYWNYNCLSYDDKIMDGFYDLYGVLTESISNRMPSLVDLQGTPLSDSVTWEAILVNRAADANLLKLEQMALEIVIKNRSNDLVFADRNLVRRLAELVANQMGGSVGDPEKMTRKWKNLSYTLKATLGSLVLPLGSLTVGLARHRALLFKLLADGVDIPCRLVKGHQYTGFDDVAMNFVRIDDGREYIVDLMADPGTLIPADAALPRVAYDESNFHPTTSFRDVGSSSSGIGSSFEENADFGTLDKKSAFNNIGSSGKEGDDKEESTYANVSGPSRSGPSRSEEGLKKHSDNSKSSSNAEKAQVQDFPGRSYMHTRSPSWTEGVSSPDVRRKKVKDVSQYMIDAAIENPQLAQKLHNVLLESGVVAPPNLFTEIYNDQLDMANPESKSDEMKKQISSKENSGHNDYNPGQILPPLPQQKGNFRTSPTGKPQHVKHADTSGSNFPPETREPFGQLILIQSDRAPGKYNRKVPVAAAAAAAAAVVASSMVVAAAKSSADAGLELPLAAAAAATATATATAAAVVATTAAVSKQYEQVDLDGAFYEPMGIWVRENDGLGAILEGERTSDRSVGNESTKSDATLDDVAECEIAWEEITLGERIGLGSYGEVYRGDWLGTEVAVKRFLDQDISGEMLEEFKSEVRIMKRIRHPNVVLFMGAVTRAPNLSIVTEFLPRYVEGYTGSLYRLIHRHNNQLDERKRLKMALDAARGMNYLHNCSPVIVHRDLKSPNLLVDKNWVVKVCDFGLSRMKHSTYLSSKSTAGTAEWMAPEVLRNEPSDEKCDVFSYGVILWELSTLRQPWGGMNPMQVVGAVGFQHRRLDIPDDMDPTIADIISKCWQTDPKLRPTFAEIMAALKPLQKPMNNPQSQRAARVAESSVG